MMQDRRREQHRRWQADYRRRQRAGLKLAEVPPSMIELLIVSHRLTAKQSDDPKAIGKALDEMALETLRAHGRTNNVSPTRGTCPPTSLPGSSVR